MPKLIMTRGLPASGKSTWAKNLLKQHGPNSWKTICKDDLRAMLDDNVWSKGNEKFVIQVRNNIIKEALLDGKNVISADTNLSEKHEAQLRQIAKDCSAEFQVKFFDVLPE